MRTHRSVARLSALALTSMAVTAGLTSASAPADAATATYAQPAKVTINDRDVSTSNTTPITFGSTAATPGSVYPSPITVAGQPGSITDVNVGLSGIAHTFPDDLDVLLVGPAGQQVVLMSDVGGSTDVSGLDLTLDDEAVAPLPDAGPLVAGGFQPTNIGLGDVFPAPAPPAGSAGSSLTAFDGASPNGTWNLYAADDSSGDGGQIGGWTLSITTDASPTVATPYPSTITVSGAPNGVTDVNLQLKGVTHTSPADIDILLVGPGGQRAVVMSDEGGGTPVSGLDLTLDDQAAGALPPGGTALTTGTFQPTNNGPGDLFPAPAPDATGAGSALAVFNGTNPDGTWSLFVVDDANGDAGSLAGGWALQITTADVPAAPVITAPADGGRDRDGAFTLAGVAPSGTTVKVLEGVAPKATVTSSALGQWAAPLTGVPNGPHTFTATATDAFGNVSAPSAGRLVIVDGISPLVSSTVPAKGAKRASTRADIRATMNEAVRRITVSRSHAFVVAAGTRKHLRARVSYLSGTRQVVIDPRKRLAHRTTYKVTVTTDVLDLAGNPLDQNRTRSGTQKKTWKFTTR